MVGQRLGPPGDAVDDVEVLNPSSIPQERDSIPVGRPGSTRWMADREEGFDVESSWFLRGRKPGEKRERFHEALS